MRALSEPQFEPAHRLMQQHAETIGGFQTARPRGRKQWRFQRHVNKVGDNGMRRQQADVDFERGLAVHAERGRVHQQLRARQEVAENLPRDRMNVAAELVGKRAGLLVNTTSLGMHGQPALELDTGLLPQNAVVADLVYVPLQTLLLAAAQGRGLKTADGLGMLLHQAVRGFELWFGRRPEVTPELRALVEADLTKT